MRKVINASNVLGTMAFLAMIAAVGAVEWAIENGGPYWEPTAFVALFAGCAYLSIREDRKKR